MKIKILLSAAALLTGPLLIARAAPADDVTSAAQKLAGEPGYSWQLTVVVPPDSRFKPGPTQGKTAGGLTYVKMTFRNNDTEMFMKGTNIVVTDQNGDWETLADFQSDDQGPGRFLGGMLRNFKLPAAQALDLLAGVTNLQQTAGGYSGGLTPDAARKLLTFRRGNATVSNPSGTATFWVANGELTKFEYHVKGTVTFNGNDVDMDRDSTVAISDVGTTKIDVPDDAKKLLP